MKKQAIKVIAVNSRAKSCPLFWLLLLSINDCFYLLSRGNTATDIIKIVF